MEPGPKLTSVAIYRRTVEAPIDRVWENVYDWEHLPWLHRETFAAIEHLDSGDWGWRARLRLQPAVRPPEADDGRDRDGGSEIVIELVTDRSRSRYVSRTLEGRGAGSEIWTRLVPRGPRTDVEVDFQVPDADPASAADLGAAYVASFTRLWDQDEGMMRRREELLGPAPPAAAPVALGPVEEVRARAPFVVRAGGRAFRVAVVDGGLVAYSTLCPHALGPLDDAPLDHAVVTCPWHGYRFDVRTGRSCGGRPLRLERARIAVGADGEARLEPRGSARAPQPPSGAESGAE